MGVEVTKSLVIIANKRKLVESKGSLPDRKKYIEEAAKKYGIPVV